MDILPSLSLAGTVIRLEPLAAAHLDALCEIGLDPELWSQTTIHVATRDDMAGYIATALAARVAGTSLPFVVVETRSGKIIGSTRYHTIVPEHRRLEIGFTWMTRSWQRTAANTEVKYLLLRHAFEHLGCGRVEFKADAENAPSCRALGRIGATREGTLRSCRISARRGVRDLAIFSIIATDWPRVRAGLESKLGR